jgi:hypothetical protein
MNLSEEKIEELRKKKKWKKIASDLHDKNIENEVDEDGKYNRILITNLMNLTK